MIQRHCPASYQAGPVGELRDHRKKGANVVRRVDENGTVWGWRHSPQPQSTLNLETP